jgi:hypothetical protein
MRLNPPARTGAIAALRSASPLPMGEGYVLCIVLLLVLGMM